MDAAGSEIGAVHPRAARAFEEVQAILAQLEHPQVRGHRADVHDVAADVEHMVADARQLGEQDAQIRSEEHTSELQSLMRISYAVFCLKKKNTNYIQPIHL